LKGLKQYLFEKYRETVVPKTKKQSQILHTYGQKLRNSFETRSGNGVFEAAISYSGRRTQRRIKNLSVNEVSKSHSLSLQLKIQHLRSETLTLIL
jgi:hypothetical protein